MFEIIPESSALPLCAQCARHQRTCCQDTDVFVTVGDLERIERHTGRSDCHEYRAATNPEYLDQDDDPVWVQHVFRPDGTRRVLRQRPDGDCMFLGGQGCVLPQNVRPLICRLYPFGFDADGLDDSPSTACPVHLLPPGRDVLAEMDMDMAAARRWHRQLYEELKLEEPVSCASV